MEQFEKWLFNNKVCDKEGYLWFDKDTKMHINEIIKQLDELSKILNNKQLIRVNILDSKNYKDIKSVMDIFCDNKDSFKNQSQYDLYLELLNYYLKYMLTTYEKKYDIDKYIEYYNSENIDISNISMYSTMIYKELCKWPNMYIILKGKNTVTRSIAKDNYSLLCIPMFSNKKIIPNEYLGEEFRIKRVKLNIFISKLEKDKNNHATAIALNPKFEGKDKVFIEIEDSFWYYYADMSNYFE